MTWWRKLWQKEKKRFAIIYPALFISSIRWWCIMPMDIIDSDEFDYIIEQLYAEEFWL